MTKKVLAYDDQTGQCELASVAPNTGMISSDGSVTLQSNQLTNGQTVYDLSIVQQTFQYSVVNDYDGDGIIQIQATVNDPVQGAVSQIITIAETEQEEGVYLKGPVTINNGIVTFTTANDEGEANGPNVTLDLTSLISSPHPSFTGAGSTTASYNSGTNTWTIDSEDISANITNVSNGDGTTTYTFQNQNENGGNVGLPTTWTTQDTDDTASVIAGTGVSVSGPVQNGNVAQYTVSIDEVWLCNKVAECIAAAPNC